jgi:predicted phosphoribosyltransferase
VAQVYENWYDIREGEVLELLAKPENQQTKEVR